MNTTIQTCRMMSKSYFKDFNLVLLSSFLLKEKYLTHQFYTLQRFLTNLNLLAVLFFRIDEDYSLEHNMVYIVKTTSITKFVMWWVYIKFLMRE